MDLLPNIPVDMVERIEMIRGPATTIYGEFAYSGVLNVITHSDYNSIYSGTGSYDTYSSGFNFFKNTHKKDLSINLNLNFQSTKRGHLASETDVDNNWEINADEGVNDESIFNQGALSFLRQSKKSKNRKNLISAITKIDFKSFVLDGYYIENQQGSFYSTYQEGIFLNREFSLSDSVTAKLKTGWQNQVSNENYAQFYILSPQTAKPVYEIEYNAEKYHGGIDFFWENTDNNKLTFGLNYSFSKPVSLWRNTGNGEQSVELDDRELISLFCEDIYSLNEKSTLTFGLRYDHYDDLKHVFSPRISAIHRLSEKRSSLNQHIIKAQYARAFKPPVFFDQINAGAEKLAINKSNKLETNDTFEISYIFTGCNSIVRFTGLYSLLSLRPDADTIDFNSPNEKKTIYGAEFEVEHDLLKDILKLDTNCSYANAKDDKTGKEIPDSIDWLANAGLKWSPLSSFTLSFNYSFAGKGNSNNKTSNSSPVHSSDLTAFFKPGKSGFNLYFGIKNIFNENVRYPSHLDQDHQLQKNNFISYPEDYQRPERWWWMKVAYDF